MVLSKISDCFNSETINNFIKNAGPVTLGISVFTTVAAVAVGAIATSLLRNPDYYLFLGCERSSKVLVKLALIAGANPNAVNERGQTPLLLACLEMNERQEAIINLLIEKGANVKICNPMKRTPFWNACFANDYQYSEVKARVLTKLLSKGAEIDDNAEMGWTAMHVVCFFEGDPKLVEFLLKKGANPNALDPNEESPLFKACEKIKKGKEEIINLLITNGGKVNIHNKFKKTPFSATCSADHYKYSESKAKMLLALKAKGADINAKNGIGAWNVLHEICLYDGDPELVGFLIGAGINIDARDEREATPLHYAVASKTVENVRQLLTAGAAVDAKDKDGRTVRDQKFAFPGIMKLVETAFKEKHL